MNHFGRETSGNVGGTWILNKQTILPRWASVFRAQQKLFINVFQQTAGTWMCIAVLQTFIAHESEP